jgi:hypothetical protein
LKDIKERVRTAQMRAALAVNRELILLYWSIGRDILVRQEAEGWGTKVIERLAKDLGAEFPGSEKYPRIMYAVAARPEGRPPRIRPDKEGLVSIRMIVSTSMELARRFNVRVMRLPLAEACLAWGQVHGVHLGYSLTKRF